MSLPYRPVYESRDLPDQIVLGVSRQKLFVSCTCRWHEFTDDDPWGDDMDDEPQAPPDELFYRDGRWYMYRPPVFALPDLPFCHEDAFARQMRRDWLWSMSLAPAPGPLCLITGV